MSCISDGLIKDLINIGAVKYGNFTLKSGATSNIYFDLRQIYSHPDLLKKIVKLICERDHTYDLVCGVPIAGIPYATAYSLETNTPMIILRPTKKEYGTGKLIEGKYSQGKTVLLIEDVTSTGASIMKAKKQLEQEGLIVYMTTIIDRRLTIDKPCNPLGDTIDAFLTMKEIESLLTMKDFNRQFHNPVATKLWNIMNTKKTNLCLSLDEHLDSNLLSEIGNYICLLKIHCDVGLLNIDISILEKLAELKNFLILDDRKYADIGSIVTEQLKNCPLSTVHSATVHSIFGQSTLDGLFQSSKISSCLLIAQSSAKDNFIDDTYTKKTIQLANKNASKIAGFICQQAVDKDSNFLYLTPGVSHTLSNDSLGQQYRSIEDAIIRDKCDIIIVGRSIYKSDDPVATAKLYTEIAWKALQSTENKNVFFI
jgi:uridine monophosphate synthetase